MRGEFVGVLVECEPDLHILIMPQLHDPTEGGLRATCQCADWAPFPRQP